MGDKLNKNFEITNQKIILIIVLVMFSALIIISSIVSYEYKIRSYMTESFVRDSNIYTVNSIEDIQDYKGKDTIFTIDITKNENSDDNKLELISYIKIYNKDNLNETYLFIPEDDMNLKYDENNEIPIKFSFPVDAGESFSYKIGIIENNKKLIYYTEGEHIGSQQTIEDKLINEYKEYIIETQNSIEEHKNTYGENIIENEIDLEEYEEILKADPEDINTWPKFILDKVYNNEF